MSRDVGTRMSAGIALGAALLSVTGCGVQEPKPGADPSPTSSTPSAVRVGNCALDDPAVTGARTLVRADLDGDGREESVRLAEKSPCAGTLFAETGDGIVQGSLTEGERRGQVRALTLPGEPTALLATREQHPRGGFQVRLYAARGAELAQLTRGGANEPLVPFVATDTRSPTATLRCVPGAVRLMTAQPTEPRGVLLSYDVQQQDFGVDEGKAVPGKVRTVRQTVPERDLAAAYPALAANRMFVGC